MLTRMHFLRVTIWTRVDIGQRGTAARECLHPFWILQKRLASWRVSLSIHYRQAFTDQRRLCRLWRSPVARGRTAVSSTRRPHHRGGRCFWLAQVHPFMAWGGCFKDVHKTCGSSRRNRPRNNSPEEKGSSPIADKRCLVTGGAGFIGSTIVDQLLDAGVAEVIVLDNFVRGSSAIWHMPRQLARQGQSGKGRHL